MGKRRNAKEEYHSNRTTNRYSVFEFAEDDLRVESDSRKTLAKFATKSPNKRSAHQKPVDKYTFLASFAHGAIDRECDSGNDMSDLDVTYTVLPDRNTNTNVTVSHGSLNSESKTISLLKHDDVECSACGAKSSTQGSRKPGKKLKNIFNVDSDDDGSTELNMLTSCYQGGNEGLSEKSPAYVANADDCEAVVIVHPNYVKIGATYYTKCLLTFSQSFIRLNGSPLSEGKRPCFLQWSTFDILEIVYQQCENVKADVVNFRLKLKDTEVVKTRNGYSDALELEFVVLGDPQWSKKQEEIKSLDPKYGVAWNTIISECFSDEPFENIIYPEGDPDAVFMSRSDIELLQPRTFINDTIIDFYFKYLVNRTKQEEQRRFHIFNTFFFRKLVDMDLDLCRTSDGKEAYQRVRKWTRNVNLFQKDYIFIPVNFSLHWSLIVICHPGKVANLRDSDMDDSTELPCILHMDSIRGSHGGFENLIRSYLLEEWKKRHGKEEADIERKFLNLDFYSLELPQQENLFDCGLFLLHYAELFLEQALNFTSRKCLDFLKKDWFLPAEVSLKKRYQIRKLIHRLAEGTMSRDPRATCPVVAQENNLKRTSPRTKFNSRNEYKINGRSCYSADVLEPRNINNSLVDECSRPIQPLLPINQFNNMRLPMEDEALEKQATFSQCDTKHTDVEDEKCVHEVARSTQRDRGRCENSPVSNEDVATCVVEDSEEEIASENIHYSRRASSLISPICYTLIRRESCQQAEQLGRD